MGKSRGDTENVVKNIVEEEEEQVGVRLSDNSAAHVGVGMKEMESPENCACRGIFPIRSQ